MRAETVSPAARPLAGTTFNFWPFRLVLRQCIGDRRDGRRHLWGVGLRGGKTLLAIVRDSAGD